MLPEIILPATATVFVWWISTGVVLWVVRRSDWSWTTLAATPILFAGFLGLHFSSGNTTVAGAYVATLSALLVWSWIEVSFLTGTITGPTKTACPAHAAGLNRVLLAINSILYHELALIACGLVVLFLTLGTENQFGLATYMLLWTLRLSAKLNLFLGVRNLGTEFLPCSLVFLATFFRRRAMNPLFPLSVTAATVLFTLLVQQAFLPGASRFDRTGLVILATLTALAVIEHWFLILPIALSPLWRWALERSPSAENSRVPNFDTKRLRDKPKGGSPVVPVIVTPPGRFRQPELSSTCSTRSGL